MNNFLAFEVTQTGNMFSRGVVRREHKKLQDNHVEIRIYFSAINYKDALAATKNGGVIQGYPKIPGIDLAGEIVASADENWPVGQQVLVTGYGLGVSVDGGFSQYQQVPTDWLIALPEPFSTKDAMLLGTAGVTAALAVRSLEEANIAKDAPIVVTGASGGVGSISLALLHSLGYSNIIALSRKTELSDWFIHLGATNVLSPEQFFPEKIKPLGKQSIAGLIDTVGGEQLGKLLPHISYGGRALLCGNAGGIQLKTTVLPFILRGIQLIGIDSVAIDTDTRKEIWQFLAQNQAILAKLHYQEVLLTDLDETIEALLEGKHQGRTLVNMEVK